MPTTAEYHAELVRRGPGHNIFVQGAKDVAAVKRLAKVEPELFEFRAFPHTEKVMGHVEAIALDAPEGHMLADCGPWVCGDYDTPVCPCGRHMTDGEGCSIPVEETV